MISRTLTMKQIRVCKLPEVGRFNGREAGRVKHQFNQLLTEYLRNGLLMTRRAANDFRLEGEGHWLIPLSLGGCVDIGNLVFIPDLAKHGCLHKIIRSQTLTMADGEYRTINVPFPEPGALVWNPAYPVPMRGIGLIERCTPEFLACLGC